MANHDIEDEVEMAIEDIDRSNLPLFEKRNLIYSLFKLQRDYDGGWTCLRLKEILHKYYYLFHIPVTMHADYEEYKSDIEEAIATKDYPFWFGNNCILDEDIPEENDNRYFYCEAGCDDWTKLIASGAITGNGSLPIQEVPEKDLTEWIDQRWIYNGEYNPSYEYGDE
ncbi:MAG: hypothetical protein ACK5MK_05150 [Dysgonomonas sp.]